jgi:hypothetical protein
MTSNGDEEPDFFGEEENDEDKDKNEINLIFLKKI